MYSLVCTLRNAGRVLLIYTSTLCAGTLHACTCTCMLPNECTYVHYSLKHMGACCMRTHTFSNLVNCTSTKHVIYNIYFKHACMHQISTWHARYQIESSTQTHCKRTHTFFHLLYHWTAYTMLTINTYCYAWFTISKIIPKKYRNCSKII